MSDPFADYGHRATSKQPDRFVGAVKTRAQMRLVYAAAVEELQKCETVGAVAQWRQENAALITQIHAEHEFFWTGDADFLGLEREIERATARVDDRLDLPRWDH